MTTVNMYVLNVDIHNFIKQTQVDVRGQIGPDTIIGYDFNATLTSIDRPSRQKKNQQRNSRVRTGR
jgi:hypothetical protein